MVQSLEDTRQRVQTGTRVPPHNLGAEQSLLGAMLLSRDAIASAVETTSAGDFYKPAHGHIFDAITSLYSQGEPADPMTVADVLARAGLLESVGGLPALVSLQSDTPATGNAGRYAKIVEEHALLRRLIGVAGEIAELGYSVPENVIAAIDRAESLVFEIAERRVTDTLKPLRELLDDSLERLTALYSKGDAITGVPTGFIDLDERLSGLQKSALIIVGARPAMGKCVAWDTRIVDAATGEVRTVEDLHRRHAAAGHGVEVLSLGDDRRLGARPVSAWVDDGVKPVFRVVTRLGREVRTTASHPFLTPDGWMPLRELTPGTAVAVPGRLPVFGTDRLPDADVALLGHLTAAGGEGAAVPRVTAVGGAVLDDLRDRAAALGVRVVPDPTGPGRAGGGVDHLLVTPAGTANPALELLRTHGLWHVRPDALAVPAAVFRAPRDQVALYLNRLWAAAGSAVPGPVPGRPVRLTLPARSKTLVRDVAHLLLRFGVTAAVRVRAATSPGEPGPRWELQVVEADQVARFVERIGLFAEQDAWWQAVPARTMASVSRAGGADRPVPASPGGDLTGGVAPGPAGGRGREAHPSAGRTAPTDSRVAPTGHAGVTDDTRRTDDTGTTEVRSGDVVWDVIVSITPDGEDRVYDLTVPVTHNFVADDVVVHNTAFALGIAAHAAMKANVPTLVFSLEMSHEELTQRLLVSEARVDASRLRNGRLVESDWPRIVNAIGRLGEAPLYIDDNPNLTIMEVRAKARRLKAKEEGLGLIIIDYLQLMTGRTSAENRQVEVSEMSRGLKILARELEVPVVALSQLSRNLESRADKRPMLADLRESGSLEQDADVVMFIYRDEVYDPESADRGTAEIIVSKHRNGPTGKTTLAFLDHHTRFEDMARL